MAHRQLPQYVTNLPSAMPTNYNLYFYMVVKEWTLKQSCRRWQHGFLLK